MNDTFAEVPKYQGQGYLMLTQAKAAKGPHRRKPHNTLRFISGEFLLGWHVYTREMGTICPFGVFFPSFTAFFASKLAIFPLRRSVLGA